MQARESLPARRRDLTPRINLESYISPNLAQNKGKASPNLMKPHN
jgi:hypothetical protein